MHTYTHRQKSLDYFLITVCGLGFASCSTLWGPWVDNLAQSCSNLSNPCPTGQLCSVSTQQCEPELPELPELVDMNTNHPPACAQALLPDELQLAPQNFGTEYYRSVWGFDASNVWAVGDHGTIAKWSGTSWGPQTSPNKASLNAVWGSSTTNVFAAGEGGMILKGDYAARRPTYPDARRQVSGRLLPSRT